MKQKLKRRASAIVLSALAVMPFGLTAKFHEVANDDDPSETARDREITIAPPEGGVAQPVPGVTDESLIVTDEVLMAYRLERYRDDRIVIASSGKDKAASLVLRQFKTAADIESACLANSVDSLLSDLQREENMTRTQAAIRVVNALSEDQIKELPSLARADLTSAISLERGMTLHHYMALRKIYLNSDEDTYFALWDAQKQHELAEILRDDPVMIAAREHWHEMDNDDKLAVLKDAVKLTISTYGAEFGAEPVPLDFIKHQSERLYGMYKPNERRMYLNLNASKVPEDFATTMVVTVHEALHAFHHQLIDKMKAGDIDADHDVYRYARFMEESYFRYIRAAFDYTGYRSNPTEKHSWEIEYIGDGIGRGPSYDLTESAGRLKKAEDAHKEHTSNHRAAVWEARMGNIYCTDTKLVQKNSSP